MRPDLGERKEERTGDLSSLNQLRWGTQEDFRRTITHLSGRCSHLAHRQWELRILPTRHAGDSKTHFHSSPCLWGSL